MTQSHLHPTTLEQLSQARIATLIPLSYLQAEVFAVLGHIPHLLALLSETGWDIPHRLAAVKQHFQDLSKVDFL